jgi:hypothetical protein
VLSMEKVNLFIKEEFLLATSRLYFVAGTPPLPSEEGTPQLCQVLSSERRGQNMARLSFVCHVCSTLSLTTRRLALRVSAPVKSDKTRRGYTSKKSSSWPPRDSTL